MPKIAALVVALLLALPSMALAQSCDRESFGGFAQKDQRDTRYWVLVSQAVGPLTFRTSGNGKVIVGSGSWIDPYSGRRLADVEARELEIDHVIPVCWAWYRGASAWTGEQKRAFYNDRRYLLAVEAGLNRQKGAMGPDQFVPMNRAFACNYIELFLEGVSAWELEMSRDEARQIEVARSAACASRAPSFSLRPVVRTSAR